MARLDQLKLIIAKFPKDLVSAWIVEYRYIMLDLHAEDFEVEIGNFEVFPLEGDFGFHCAVN